MHEVHRKSAPVESAVHLFRRQRSGGARKAISCHRPLYRGFLHLFLDRPAHAINERRLRALETLGPPAMAAALIGEQMDKAVTGFGLGRNLQVTLWARRDDIANVAVAIVPVPPDAIDLGGGWRIDSG